MLATIHVAFVLHLIIETAASVNFLLRPSATLSVPQPYSHGVIRQYGLLLLSINIIVAVLLYYPIDSASRLIALALAFYHVGPTVRAVSRIQQREVDRGIFENPWLHVVLHVVTGSSLAISFISNSF